MSAFVLDASVVIKWFVPEVYQAEALRLVDPTNEYAAPDLLFAEIANVLWMKVRRGHLSRDAAQQLVDDLDAVPVATISCKELASGAHALAIETGSSVYDAMYLALAIRLDRPLITADQRLVNTIRGFPALAQHIRFIADVPQS